MVHYSRSYCHRTFSNLWRAAGGVGWLEAGCSRWRAAGGCGWVGGLVAAGGGGWRDSQAGTMAVGYVVPFVGVNGLGDAAVGRKDARVLTLLAISGRLAMRKWRWKRGG